MKKGCLVSLAIWAGVAYGLWYFVARERLTPQADIVAPIAAGFLAMMLIGLLRNGAASSRDAKLLAQISRPDLTRSMSEMDGKVIAVAGKIHTMSPMRAPFSGRPCVLYGYEMTLPNRGPKRRGHLNVAAGMALTPCAIDSTRGRIRLLGFPLLEGWDKDVLDADDATVARAKSYIASAQAVDMTGLKLAKAYGEIKDQLADDDGTVKRDWKLVNEFDYDEVNFKEEVVQPGEEVCAIGLYSAAKSGIVPKPGQGHINRLIRGNAQSAEKRIRTKARGEIIGGLIFLLVAGGIGTLALTMWEMNGAPQARERARGEFNYAAAQSDFATMEKIVKRYRISIDEPLLNISDPKVARWLIDRGANVNVRNDAGTTPLMVHAQRGDAEIVKMLLAKGAALNTRDVEQKRTALGWAIVSDQPEVAELLRAAGAVE